MAAVPPDADRDPPSTGFLPLSLAVALFVTGLFVLGFVPLPSCGDRAADEGLVTPSAPEDAEGDNSR